MSILKEVFQYRVGKENTPAYIKWAIWCWHQPVYIGLPLTIFAFPIMAIDIIYLAVFIPLKWGKL